MKDMFISNNKNNRITKNSIATKNLTNQKGITFNSKLGKNKIKSYLLII